MPKNSTGGAFGRWICRYSSASGSSAIPVSPAAFFVQYFFIQASQLFPAAVSRPVKARAEISEYGMESLALESLGRMRTAESARVALVRRSEEKASTLGACRRGVGWDGAHVQSLFL